MLLCRRRFVKLTADVERLRSYVAIGCQASFATRQAASQTCQWAAPPWNPCIGCNSFHPGDSCKGSIDPPYSGSNKSL